MYLSSVFFSQALFVRLRAPIKIMLKMCSSSLQRKKFRLYRCKRKKENQGPRRKYERNNMPGARPRNRRMWVRFSFVQNFVGCRWIIIFFPLLLSIFSLAYFHLFPVLTVAKTHPPPSLVSRAIILFPLSHRQSLYHTQPALSISSSIFHLSLSLSFILSTFFLSHFHSRSHSFALIEYNRVM